MEVYHDILLPAQTFMYDWRNTLDVLAGLSIAWGIVSYAEIKRKQRRKAVRKEQGKRMTRKERMKYLHSQAGKAFSDWLVDMEVRGVFTSADVKYLARRGSYAFDTTDTIPQPGIDVHYLTAEEKEIVEGILRSKSQLRKLVESRLIPCKIPGPKPGEVDNVVLFDKPKRKFGDQLK